MQSQAFVCTVFLTVLCTAESYKHCIHTKTGLFYLYQMVIITRKVCRMQFCGANNLVRLQQSKMICLRLRLLPLAFKVQNSKFYTFWCVSGSGSKQREMSLCVLRCGHRRTLTESILKSERFRDWILYFKCHIFMQKFYYDTWSGNFNETIMYDHGSEWALVSRIRLLFQILIHAKINTFSRLRILIFSFYFVRKNYRSIWNQSKKSSICLRIVLG
jgi:hypothetical protein